MKKAKLISEKYGIWEDGESFFLYLIAYGRDRAHWLDNFIQENSISTDAVNIFNLVPTLERKSLKIKARILKGISFAEGKRTDGDIQKKVKENGLSLAHPDISLIAKSFIPNEALEIMGIERLIIMHKHIHDPANHFGMYPFFCLEKGKQGKTQIKIAYKEIEKDWKEGDGFLLIESEQAMS